MESKTLVEIKSLLKSLDGVLDAVTVSPEDVEKIIEIENEFRESDMPLINSGMNEMINRAEHLVIVKNLDFPQPPEPTFYLVRECSEVSDDGKFFHVSGRIYEAVGEEIVEGWTDKSKGLVASDSLLLYNESRKNRKAPASFIFPPLPLPFPDLETRSHEFGIKNIISATPNTQVCRYLNEAYGLSSGGEIALLVIGFDWE